jgi:hypothetical protein
MVLLAVLAACSGPSPEPGPTPSSSPSPSPSVTPAVASDFAGRWGEPGPEGVHVEIVVDGRLAGYDGCNGFGSLSWSMVDERAVPARTAHGLKGCGSVDQWLTPAMSYGLVSGRLVVFDGAGRELGSLGRSGSCGDTCATPAS